MANVPVNFVNTWIFSGPEPVKGQLVACDTILTGIANGVPGPAGLAALGLKLPKFNGELIPLLEPLSGPGLSLTVLGTDSDPQASREAISVYSPRSYWISAT